MGSFYSLPPSCGKQLFKMPDCVLIGSGLFFRQGERGASRSLCPVLFPDALHQGFSIPPNPSEDIDRPGASGRPLNAAVCKRRRFKKRIAASETGGGQSHPCVGMQSLNGVNTQAPPPRAIAVSVGFEYESCLDLILWEKRTAALQGYELDASSMGGWTLDKHHILDVQNGEQTFISLKIIITAIKTTAEMTNGTNVCTRFKNKMVRKMWCADIFHLY